MTEPDPKTFDVFRSGTSPLRVVVAPDPAAATAAVLDQFGALLTEPAPPTVGLATGATFHSFYHETARREVAGTWDLRRVRFTHLDEYRGWAGDRPGSMAHELRERFFERLARGVAAFLPVDATGDDPAGMIQRHERALAGLGGIDLQLLGIGRNGHIAFNEPGTSFGKRTHVAKLAPDTIAAQGDRFRGAPPPEEALSLGIANILEARRLCLLACGASKAAAVRDLLEGPISPRCPATALHLHPDALVVLDRDAAALLGSDSRWIPEPTPFTVFEPADLRNPGKVLVVSPHPDDASISCGGLLASLPPDAAPLILTMTTGGRARVRGLTDPGQIAALREREVAAEAEALGCRYLFLRGRFYDSGAMEEEDVAALLAILHEEQPDRILAPATADAHPTHAMSRHVLDAALRRYRAATGARVEVWTFEGPWHHHPPARINALVHFDATAEERKLRGIRAHRSQIERVPFDDAALAMARVRGVGYSESHFGGATADGLRELPRVEAFIRETY